MNQQLMDKILNSPRLPSLPVVAATVIEQCRQPELNIPQIAETISNDPALVAKILKTVNSSFYGLRQRIASVSQAMVILGLNNVKTLALSFSLVSNLRESNDSSFNFDIIWKRSLYSAVAARVIAKRAQLPEHEEVLLGGLLQDLGIIAMVQTLKSQYLPLLVSSSRDLSELWKLERRELEIDHAQVGTALAQSFRLPDLLVDAIKHHEIPTNAPSNVSNIAKAVTLGSIAADCFVAPQPNNKLAQFIATSNEWFQFDNDTCKELLDSIAEDTRELARLFEIESRPESNPIELMSEAQDLLAEQSFQAQQNIQSLEKQNETLQQRASDLEIKATTDPLTGAYNRGKFDEAISILFNHAVQQTVPISVLMIDADRFKSVNDTYGHQAGDKVLISLAETLKNSTPKSAVVARYGGEEFSIILPGLDRKQAASTAEAVRAAIESTPIDIESDSPLTITASIGVACFDGVRFFKSPDQLIQAADQGTYAAKAAGRNKVRVFVPKEPTAASPATT